MELSHTDLQFMNAVFKVQEVHQVLLLFYLCEITLLPGSLVLCCQQRTLYTPQDFPNCGLQVAN